MDNTISETRRVIKPHRFVFAPSIIETLSEFSKLHQLDDRKTYKKAWTAWIDTEPIRKQILEEETRLQQLGFVGDIVNKLFLSSRYYYRTKTKADAPAERKAYQGLPKSILHVMDAHIREHMSIPSTHDLSNIEVIAPADSFQRFCEENQEVLVHHVRTNYKGSDETIENNMIDTIAKFKKTYKNRFYLIRTSSLL